MQALSYVDLLSITANSALDTAHLCYRKARRDVHRIHALLTHPTTVEALKIAIWCLYIGAVISFALGQTARILVQHWVDAEVARALKPSESVDVQPILPEALVSAELTDLDLVLTDSEPDLQNAQDVDVADVEPVDYRTLTTAQLRRECVAAGIRWKDARGKNRHLTKVGMIVALECSAAA